MKRIDGQEALEEEKHITVGRGREQSGLEEAKIHGRGMQCFPNASLRCYTHFECFPSHAEMPTRVDISSSESPKKRLI